MDVAEAVDSVSTREDLTRFALALRDDLLANPAEWENPTLDRFLEAFAAWCHDMPGYFANRGEEEPQQPDWRLVARMLMAAAIYE